MKQYFYFKHELMNFNDDRLDFVDQIMRHYVESEGELFKHIFNSIIQIIETNKLNLELDYQHLINKLPINNKCLNIDYFKQFLESTHSYIRNSYEFDYEIPIILFFKHILDKEDIIYCLTEKVNNLNINETYISSIQWISQYCIEYYGL